MQISYKWTKERFLEAGRANYYFKLQALKFRLPGYLGLAFMLAGAYFAYSKGVYATLTVATFLTVYWYFLRWPLYSLQLAHQFKKHVSKDQDITWEMDTDSFSIKSVSGFGKYSWDAVTDLAEMENGFLVYQYPIYYWLPKDSFASENDIAWFRNTIIDRISARQSST